MGNVSRDLALPNKATSTPAPDKHGPEFAFTYTARWHR